VREIDHDYPDLRVRELTATARLQIVAEHGGQPVKTIVDREVGPLTMGEPVVLERVSWQFDPSAEPTGIDPDPGNPYHLYAMVRDCRLSNGAACGNNSQRYFFAPPDGFGTSEQGLGAGAGLTIPERAGGLAKLPLGSGQEGGRSNQPDPNRPIGGVPLRRVVPGLFQAGDGLGRVYFWGVELAAPLPAQTVDQAGPAMISEAFRRGLSVGVSFVPSSEPRRYDPGPLGGRVWCQTFTHTLLTTQTSYACGWVDRSTVGSILVNSYAREDLHLTEAQAAELLVAMRANLETVR
jgi:hypothetical protein